MNTSKERESHGAPAWFYKGKRCFCNYIDHHHGVDWIALWIAAQPGLADSLVESDPETYFIPPYVGVRGWVAIRSTDQTDGEDVESLLGQSHHLIVSKK